MPPLAPNPRDLLLIGAPCPVNELRAGDEHSEYRNRVGVMIAECVLDVRDAIPDFDPRHSLNKARSTHTHTQAPPTRSAHDAAERDRLTDISISAQPNVAAGFGSFVNGAAGLAPSVASQHAGAI